MHSIMSEVVVERRFLEYALLLHSLVNRHAAYAALIVGPYTRNDSLKRDQTGILILNNF